MKRNAREKILRRGQSSVNGTRGSPELKMADIVFHFYEDVFERDTLDILEMLNIVSIDFMNRRNFKNIKNS